jgi:NADH dehydrogenase FAD-containing subunit
MERHLLMLGGGHAQLSLLDAAPGLIAAGHRLTLVSPEPVHYYSGMGPGMLAGTYDPSEIRFPIRRMAEEAGVRFIRDRALRIKPDDRVVELAGGASLEYDVLSVNTGSSVAPRVAVDAVAHRSAADGLTAGAPRVFTVKPISQLVELRQLLEARRLLEAQPAGADPFRIVVVGGGPAAVEAAAGIARLVRGGAADERSTAPVTIELIVGRSILPGMPPRADRLALRVLARAGVTVRRTEYVRRVTARGIVTRAGEEPADVVLLATGVVPSRLFADSGLPVGADGSMAVNERLQCLGHPELFGAGDCVWFTPRPVARAGVFAVRESPVLLHNVTAALGEEPRRMRSFRPQRGYLLLLNLGDGNALFFRRVGGAPIVCRGGWAWRLKDRIDRRFMHRFGSEADRGNEQ